MITSFRSRPFGRSPLHNKSFLAREGGRGGHTDLTTCNKKDNDKEKDTTELTTSKLTMMMIITTIMKMTMTTTMTMKKRRTH